MIASASPLLADGERCHEGVAVASIARLPSSTDDPRASGSTADLVIKNWLGLEATCSQEIRGFSFPRPLPVEAGSIKQNSLCLTADRLDTRRCGLARAVPCLSVRTNTEAELRLEVNKGRDK